MLERFTAEQIKEMLESGRAIVCTSRCLWCGRPTPHEVCHAHGPAQSFDIAEVEDIDALWNSEQEPEECVDSACLNWEPGEFQRRLESTLRRSQGQQKEAKDV